MVLWRSRRQKFEVRRPSPSHGDAPRISCLAALGRRYRSWISPWPEQRTVCGMAMAASRRSTIAMASPSPPRYGHGLRTVDRVFIKVTLAHGCATGTYTRSDALDGLSPPYRHRPSSSGATLEPQPRRIELGLAHASRDIAAGSSNWTPSSSPHRHRGGHPQAQGAVRERHRGVLGQAVRTAGADRGPAGRGGHRPALPRTRGFRPEPLPQASRRALHPVRPLQGSPARQPDQPDRSHPDAAADGWHGRLVAHFARVCCGIARISRCLVRTYGMVEALNVAVKWSPKGPLPEPVGQLRPVSNPGIVT